MADQFKKSQSRGKLIKGSLFNSRPVGYYKQQILQLKADLEGASEEILRQKLEIAGLQNETARHAAFEIVHQSNNLDMISPMMADMHLQQQMQQQ